jgi:sugar/nucleoside kinase (ribokinase family)
VLALTDLYLPSGDELFLFSKSGNPDVAIGELLDGGVRAVVHKLGAAGARYLDRQVDVSKPSQKAVEVDPTGAGDIFGATFVVGWLNGLTPDQNLRRANIAGMLAVGRRGPMEGASSEGDIVAQLDQQQ